MYTLDSNTLRNGEIYNESINNGFDPFGGESINPALEAVKHYLTQ